MERPTLRTRFCGLIALFQLIAAPIPAGDAQTRPAPGRVDPDSVVIAGRVIDAASGRPINGAVVTLTPQDRRVFYSPGRRPFRVSVLTRPDGRFTFRHVMPGAHPLSASKPGYIAGAYGQRRPGGSSRPVKVEQAEQVDVTITLWRFAAITGTILDEAGEPVVGQEVRALQRTFAGGRSHLRLADAGWTDDRGVYRIGALSPGAYFVFPAVTQHAAPASLKEADQAPTGTAIVRIGSALHIIDVDSPVPPLLPGSDRLLIYPMQFYPGVPTAAQATPIVVGSGEERANVDFQFLPIPAARVSGRVLEAVPGSYVTLRLFQAGAIETRDAVVAEALSDATGAFAFPAVPPGDYLLKALSSSAEDNRWAVLGFAVGQRDVTGLDFVLRAGLRITGRAEFDGGPLSIFRDMHVVVEPEDGGTLDVLPQPITAPGRFAVDRVPGGTYVLRVANIPTGWMVSSITYEGRDVTDAPLALASDTNDVVITLTNRLTEVHGTARSAGGAPDPDALVVVFSADRNAWTEAGRVPPRVRAVRADEAGAYQVVGLPAGDYYIVSIPAGEMDENAPSMFAALAGSAEVVTLDEGVKKEIMLRTRTASKPSR